VPNPHAVLVPVQAWLIRRAIIIRTFARTVDRILQLGVQYLKCCGYPEMIMVAYSPRDLTAPNAGASELGLFGTVRLSGVSAFATVARPLAAVAVGLTVRGRSCDARHYRETTRPDGWSRSETE
jgi:hypothetical protein